MQSKLLLTSCGTLFRSSDLGKTHSFWEEIRQAVHDAGLPERVIEIMTDPGFSLEDRSGWYALREACFDRFDLWDAVGGVVAKIVNAQYCPAKTRSSDPAKIDARVEELRREGIVHIDPMFTDSELAEVQDYLRKRAYA